jgi:hypothetical protein
MPKTRDVLNHPEAPVFFLNDRRGYGGGLLGFYGRGISQQNGVALRGEESLRQTRCADVSDRMSEITRFWEAVECSERADTGNGERL